MKKSNNKILELDEYEVIYRKVIVEKGERCLPKAFINTINNGIKIMNVLKDTRPDLEIVINGEGAYVNFIKIFSGSTEKVEQDKIFANDLELIFMNETAVEILLVISKVRQLRLEFNQDNTPVDEQFRVASQQAQELISKLTKIKMNAQDLKEQLDTVERPNLVRKLIALAGDSRSLKLDSDNGPLTLFGDLHNIKSLTICEYTLKEAHIVKLNSDQSFDIHMNIGPLNANFINEYACSKDGLTIQFQYARETHQMLKFLYASSAKFDFVIIAKERIKDGEVEFHFVKLLTNESTFQQIVNSIDKLFKRIK